jgi:hypothetical protein
VDQYVLFRLAIMEDDARQDIYADFFHKRTRNYTSPEGCI